MKVIDLSHKIHSEMGTYPSDPDVTIVCEKTIESDNSLLHSIKMGTHTGTHLDVPSHIIPNGRTINSFPPEQFTGIAMKVDCNSVENIGNIDNLDGIIYDTGWYKNFSHPELFFQPERPIIPKRLIGIATELRLKFFGCDLPSVDVSGSKEKPIHNALLRKDIIIYEALANLCDLPTLEPFHFYGFPLSLENLEGSPVRAVAHLE